MATPLGTMVQLIQFGPLRCVRFASKFITLSVRIPLRLLQKSQNPIVQIG